MGGCVPRCAIPAKFSCFWSVLPGQMSDLSINVVTYGKLWHLAVWFQCCHDNRWQGVQRLRKKHTSNHHLFIYCQIFFASYLFLLAASCGLLAYPQAGLHAPLLSPSLTPLCFYFIPPPSVIFLTFLLAGCFTSTFTRKLALPLPLLASLLYPYMCVQACPISNVACMLPQPLPFWSSV